jgi:hypothetical protein
VSSVIEIANAALTKLGAARIASLGDDVKAAREVNARFEALRDDELRAHRWQFSIKRASLAALTAAPAFGYTYQYALPSDCLRIDMVNDTYPSVVMDNYITGEIADYVIEGNAILTDIAAPLKLRYVAQVTDPNSWDVSFREALACRIAAEVCEALTQSPQKRQLAWTEYQQAITRAVRSSAIERAPVMPPDDSWVISRI